jgi:hypothetical protein
MCHSGCKAYDSIGKGFEGLNKSDDMSRCKELQTATRKQVIDIDCLVEETKDFAEDMGDNKFYYNPYDPKIPKSVFKYKPHTWIEPEGIWHVSLGAIPENCIWTMGTTPYEAFEGFDRELNASLTADGKAVKMLSQEEREDIHKETWLKIDRQLGWDKEDWWKENEKKKQLRRQKQTMQKTGSSRQPTQGLRD